MEVSQSKMAWVSSVAKSMMFPVSKLLDLLKLRRIGIYSRRSQTFPLASQLLSMHVQMNLMKDTDFNLVCNCFPNALSFPLDSKANSKFQLAKSSKESKYLSQTFRIAIAIAQVNL